MGKCGCAGWGERGEGHSNGPRLGSSSNHLQRVDAVGCDSLSLSVRT